MRRVVLVDYRKLVLQNSCGDIKTLEPGTVKVDITTYSICGSGIALYRGKRSLENERYFGHEFSDVIADPNDGVNDIKKGMHVAGELSRICGHCWGYRNGFPDYYRSINDALLPGGFSRETLVLNTPEYSFIGPVPGAIDDITATLLEPTNYAYHVARQADVKHRETAVVFGMGSMGLITTRIIKSMGVDVVVGVDNSKARLEKVQSLGFIDMIDSNDGNWQDQMSEMYGSKSADVITELTGALSVLQSVFRMVRPGGCIVVGSVYNGFTDQVELLPIMHKGLTILGSKDPYPHLKTDDASVAVNILVRFQDGLEKLITVYDYKDVLEAFSDMVSGFAVKPVIRFRS